MDKKELEKTVKLFAGFVKKGNVHEESLFFKNNMVFAYSSENKGIFLCKKTDIALDCRIVFNSFKLILELVDNEFTIKKDADTNDAGINFGDCKIRGFENDFSFPEINKELKKSIIIEPKIFKEIIEKVIPIIPKNIFRCYESGAFFDFYDDKLNIVATDGKRLFLSDRTKYQGDFDKSIIIPALVLNLINTKFDDKKEITLAQYNKDYYILQQDDVFIIFQECEGTFPLYRKVIPRDNDKTFSIIVKDWLPVISKISKIPSESNRLVLNFSENLCLIKAEFLDQGITIEKKISCETFYSLKIALNSKFMHELLLNGDQIMSIKDENSTVSFMDKDNDLTIMMPMTL